MFFNKAIIPFTEPPPGQLRLRTALRTEIHEPFIRTVQIGKETSSQFAEKRPGKALIFDLNITLKTGILTGSNSRKSGRTIFGGFES